MPQEDQIRVEAAYVFTGDDEFVIDAIYDLSKVPPKWKHLATQIVDRHQRIHLNVEDRAPEPKQEDPKPKSLWQRVFGG